MDKLPESHNSTSKNSNKPLINKFRDEVSKKYKEDFVNSRKLTKTPHTPRETPEDSNDIDRQISDLEEIIKRLQDDIIQTASASSADNQNGHSKLKVKKISHDIDLDGGNDFESKDFDKILNLIKGDDEYNPFQIYPLELEEDLAGTALNKEEDNVESTLVFLPVSKSKKFDATLKDNSSLNDMDKVPAKVSAIRNTFSAISDMNPGSDDVEEDSLQVLIDELKSALSEKMDDLKNVDIGEPSDEKNYQ